MRGTRRRLSYGAVSGLLALSLTVSGCTGDDPGPAEDPEAGDFLTDAADPDGEDGLPSGFPREVAPVVDGEITSSEGTAEDGFTVTTVLYSSEVPVVLDDAVALLTRAGWRVGTVKESASFSRATLSRPEGGLAILQAFPSDDDVALTYFVRVDAS